ncbi:MAG: ABC transporter permease [Pseudomonas sp.]|uniref:ABC transporter permease n=1 Tax=Pseudomonas sp. TaxID=306 RepID=UPI001213B88F|nr:ABC transporter permease [Pseudomonas sp.]RZI72226.1 MAG: ABC transporter permease [Pseudomonas sp.]
MNSHTLWLICRRLGAGVVTLLIVSMVVFAITAVLPGDAAQQSLGQFATPEQVAALRLKLGLDQPGVLRYLHWLMNLLTGDMGQSVSNAMPVGLQFLRTYALPVMTLCCVIVAQMARMTRAAVIDQLDSPYVEMARLKGVSPIRIVLRHALPNAIGPIANAIALSLSYLLGGVVIVETIFNYPGIASLMVDAVTNRDMALVQACTMLFCAAYLALVLLADLCAILSNPRLRNQ